MAKSLGPNQNGVRRSAGWKILASNALWKLFSPRAKRVHAVHLSELYCLCARAGERRVVQKTFCGQIKQIWHRAHISPLPAFHLTPSLHHNKIPMGARRGCKNAQIHFEKASSVLYCNAGAAPPVYVFLHPDLFIASRGILISPATASSAAVIHSQALINLINFGVNSFSLHCDARCILPVSRLVCAAGGWNCDRKQATLRASLRCLGRFADL